MSPEAATVEVTSTAPLQTATEIDVFEAIADATEPEILKMLKQVHPLYDSYTKLWEEAGDVALERILSNSDKKRYLLQGRAERHFIFDQRVKLSAMLAETPGLISDFIGAIFSKSARRDIKDNKGEDSRKLQEFLDASGFDEQPIAQVAQEAARLALIFGSVDAFLDHPIDQETTVPKIVLFTPEQRLDWQIGTDGNYQWVKYKETFFFKPTWNQNAVVVDEYRIITTPIFDSKGQILVFRVIREKGKTPVVMGTDPIEHNFHSIPVRTLYWQKEFGGIGIPWIKSMVVSDIKTFRMESDLTWDTFTHAHPEIKIWVREGEEGKDPVSELNLGGAHAFHLDPGDEDNPKEDMEYLEMPTTQLRIQMDQVKEQREITRRLSSNGSDLEKSELANPESGIALAYRLSQRAKNFLQMTQNLQEWEWQLFELVLNEGSETFKELSGLLEIVYPDSFDQRLPTELHRDLRNSIEIGSPTLVKEIRKLLASRIVGEGTTAKTRDTIQKEIEALEIDFEKERELIRPKRMTQQSLSLG